MRSSSYNITTLVDNEKKLYAILNGYTHAFDIINKNVYEFIKGRESEQNISNDTLKRLIKRGYLTSLTKIEEIDLIKRLATEAHKKNLLKKFNFHFIISYDCNLRCTYCYEDDILNSCISLPKERISINQIDEAFEFITEKHINNESSKEIALYGGEPFLLENYDTILYIAEKGRKIGHKFKVISNGYDVDRYFDFLKENKYFSFQITVDGVEEIQNTRKPHYKNNNSFEKITHNIDHLLKLGIPVLVRINSDSFTLNKINELLLFFENKGWYGYKHFAANIALLREEVCQFDKEQKESHFNQFDLVKFYYLKKKQGIIKNNIFCQDYNTYGLLKNLVLGKSHTPYRSHFCGAQYGNIIFDPLGDLYSCWDVVGRSEHKIGRYIPSFQIYNEASEKWFNKNVSDFKCIKCKYNLFCGGGCIIRSLRKNNKIESGNCNNYPQVFNYMVKVVYDELIKDTI